MLSHLPELPYTLKTFVLLFGGILLIRVAGKRSISQLTVPEAVLIITTGKVLIQPLVGQNEWLALYGTTLLIIGIMLLSYIQLKVPLLRKWFYGVPTVLIADGKIKFNHLKKARMTTDELEMRLRLNNVGNVQDVKVAVLEASGMLTLTLNDRKKAATKEDLERVRNEIKHLTALVRNESGLAKEGQFEEIAYSEPPIDPLFKEAIQEDQKNRNLSIKG